MKSGYLGALKPDRLGLGCKTNKCSDAGIGDPGVLTTHEKHQISPLVMTSQVQVSSLSVFISYSSQLLKEFHQGNFSSSS